MIRQPTLKHRLLILHLRLIIFHANPHVVLLIINRSEIGGKIIGSGRARIIARCLPAGSSQELVLGEKGDIKGGRVVAAEPQSLHQDPYIVIKGIHIAVKVLQLVILNLGMVDPEFAQLEQVILISFNPGWLIKNL